MHLPTHILSGWCIGSLLPRFTPRQRLFCMLAASLADLDGLARLAGQNAYWDYHHTLTHNLPFGLALSLLLAAFSPQRLLSFTTYLAVYHLHLLMDYYGSGPGWGIAYLWPLSRRVWSTPDAWEFFSWQNLTTAAALTVWTLAIAIRQHRTPLEALMPNLDRQLVEKLQRLLGSPPARASS
jgi:membrane-bound metal-dependent hydrolase YbcI (DUF457 family)